MGAIEEQAAHALGSHAVDPRIAIHAIVDAVDWERRPERAIGLMTMLEAMLDQDFCDDDVSHVTAGGTDTVVPLPVDEYD
jgi:hypothetical protein